MKTFVRLFKPRFAPQVEAGDKLQTVRPTPKLMPRIGDRLSLRTWIGRPYRSKQRILRESVVTMVRKIRIEGSGIYLYTAGGAVWCPDRDKFSRADGFTCWADMKAWFHNTHGLPFTGVVIYWKP